MSGGVDICKRYAEMSSKREAAERAAGNEEGAAFESGSTITAMNLADLIARTAPPARTYAEGDWSSIDTAPRDGTVVLALYRDNGLVVYALSHYRTNRDGTEDWYDGTALAENPPFAWQALPTIAAAIRLLSQGEKA